MPLRDGKFLEDDECREYWNRSPAKWNQWNAAAKNYASSREVRDNVICKPMTFMMKKWKDWEQPENEQGQPLGQRPEYGAYDRSWIEERKRDEEMARQGKANF